MASYYKSITDEQLLLIEKSPLFFVATTAQPESHPNELVGPINVSPKGGVPLYIVDRNHVAYLDYAGSGNETAQHLKAGSPITVMICSFDENAAIVRLYGTGTVTAIEASPLGQQLLASDCKTTGQPLRQVIDVFVEKTATSCGYGVPIMEFGHHRRKEEHGRKYKT
ncbi:MAG: pyridoxamine 5'-phosphate oxidase family protein [Caldilineaceae bacterium]